MKYFPMNLKYLRKIAGKSQQEVAMSLGFTGVTRLSNYETGHSKPEVETLIAIAKMFSITLDDLLNTDLSNPNNLDKSVVAEPQAEYHKSENVRAINNMGILNAPLVSQYAYAGYLSGYADPVYVESLPTVPFLIPAGTTAKGTYRAFEVRGDSYDDGSSDSVLEGDIVLSRFINPDLYRAARLHINKWLFVVVHKEEGILLKRIGEHNVEAGTLTLKSLNPLYEDRVMHLSEVAEVYNVVQLLRKPKA